MRSTIQQLCPSRGQPQQIFSQAALWHVDLRLGLKSIVTWHKSYQGVSFSKHMINNVNFCCNTTGLFLEACQSRPRFLTVFLVDDATNHLYGVVGSRVPFIFCMREYTVGHKIICSVLEIQSLTMHLNYCKQCRIYRT